MTTTMIPSTASVPTGIIRLEMLRDTLARAPQPVFEFAWRLAVGATFFRSGINKIQSWDTTLDLFREEYKVPILPPEIAAVMGTAAELICPVLIVAGLLARLGAAGLLGMTFVIQFFVYPENWVEHLMWASLLAWIVSRGPGAISVDRYIARALFRRG